MFTPRDPHAFPTSPENETRCDGTGGNGMLLRDWFAAQALSGWLASFGPDGRPSSLDELARFAYLIADAMMEARQK